MGIIALPSGKNLEDATNELFAEARIDIVRQSRRAYKVKLVGLPGIAEAIYCKPSEMPRLITDGDVIAGITGIDCLREHSDRDESAFKIFTHLAYSRSTAGGTRCVIFCRGDDPTRTIADMDPEALVKSEYPRETRDMLIAAGISAPKIESCTGSAEALVKFGKYRYGVALVETGSTLVANDLRIIGEVFESSTVLVGRASLCDQTTEASLCFMARLLKGTLDARGKVYLMMNAPAKAVGEIAKVLPSLGSPTVKKTANSNLVSIDALVPRSEANRLMFQLERLGASGFVTTSASTVM